MLFRTAAARLGAIEDRRAHRHAPLSLGAASAADVDAKLEVCVDGDGVRGRRLLNSVEPWSFIASWGSFPGRIDPPITPKM